MTQEIKFGTDGWRGIIADDFTFDNVRRVAGAIASYVLKHEDIPTWRHRRVRHPLCLASRRASGSGGDRAAGIPVKLANDYTPTPAVSYAVKQRSGRRSHGHLQPQSLELERSEVQGKIRRFGYSRDHEEDRRRTGRRSGAARAVRRRSKKSILRSAYVAAVCAVRRYGSHCEDEVQVRGRCDVWFRPRIARGIFADMVCSMLQSVRN